MASLHPQPKAGKRKSKEGNVLFNDTLKTFYLWVIRHQHMVKAHTDSERGNLLPPLHGLLFPISIKGSFICNHSPDRITYTTGWNEK